MTEYLNEAVVLLVGLPLYAYVVVRVISKAYFESKFLYTRRIADSIVKGDNYEKGR